MKPDALYSYARTKIVATVGPACQDAATLRQMVRAGADLFRLNMAHGTLEQHQQTIARLREIELESGPIGILVDLAGPKIRLGQIAADPLLCLSGSEIRFVRGSSSQVEHDLVSNYELLIDELQVDDDVLLADGSVHLVVITKEEDEVVCRVENSGEIRPRQGVNLPGAKISAPSLTEHDRRCVKWAADQPIDYLSLSFVRRPEDVDDLRRLLTEHNFDVPIVAKIEKREALEQLDEVIQNADAVMVARGDLGVEIDVAEVPVAQKKIISQCNALQKPVIVATQMLDSMQNSPRPTRAETSDVANAILDGADACMLSGESAVGKYPVETVRTMNRIMMKTEELLRERPLGQPATVSTTGALPVTRAVVYAAGLIAAQIDAKLTVIATRSGATALSKSNQRHFVPAVAVSNDPEVLRRITLYWGITPIAGAPCDDANALCEFVVEWGKQHKLIQPGDRLVIVTGSNTDPLFHNSVTVLEVPK